MHCRRSYNKVLGYSSDWLGREQGLRIEFGDLRRISVVITITDPCWLDADVNQTRPTPASPTIGINLIINLGQALQLCTRRLISDTFILHGPFVASVQPANDECNAWIGSQVCYFPG